MRTEKRNPERGFTLLEILLVISILAVMLGLNAQVLTSLTSSKAVLDDLRDGQFIANSVINRLTRELQLIEGGSSAPGAPRPTKFILGRCDGSAPPAPAAGAGAGAGAVSSDLLIGEQRGGGIGGGRQDSITFLAREAGQYVPDGGTHTGVVQITYQVVEDPEPSPTATAPHLLLIREEMPHRQPLAKACEQALRFPITNSVVSLEFSYFDDGPAKAWEQDWTNPRSLGIPALIQFRIKLKTPAGIIQTYTSTVSTK